MREPGAFRDLHSHGRLVVLLSALFVPLAFVLPFSKVVLVITLAMLVALNAQVIALGRSLALGPIIQGLNFVAVGVGLALVLRPELRPSMPESAALSIGVLYLVLGILGVLAIPGRFARLAFATQQFALASTLVLQIWIEPLESAIGRVGVLSSGYFRMGLAFLFVGPLGLVIVAYLIQLAGWRRYWPALVGVCLNSLGMGLLAIGERLGRHVLVNAGALLVWSFPALLVLALVTGRLMGSARSDRAREAGSAGVE